jgi:class 3 adenylate cyclase/predicted ATPase
MTFYEVLEQALALLHRHKRVSYRALKLQFHLLGDEALEAIKDELIYQRVARDEEGKGLVWMGETLATFAPTAAVTAQRTTSDAAAITPHVAHVQPPSLPSTTVPSDRQTAQPEPIRPTPGAERRQLTVMFCDLADSTKLSQQLDPEDLRDVIRAYQQTSAEVIHRFDGTIAQHLGDGLLIYFGWPVAHEDDAQRAAHAGLGIVEAITTTLNPRLEAEKGVQLTVRLGIHTGPVVVGEMGSGGRHENLATGETVNVAARLEGLAQANTVVMSSTTARLVERSFVLEDLGPQALKGMAKPIQVFRVRGPMAVHEDETDAVGAPFLVGRDEERGLLLRRWEQSKEGLGQVVLISGEAGIGKSSLVATVRQHVAQAGYTRITFRCSPYHTNSALHPVIAHMQRVLQWQPGEMPETRLDKLERVLTGYSRPLDEVVPLYAALLAVPLPEGRYAVLNLSPQQQRHQTQDALVRWLLEEAERHPTLAMWEDLHWADPSTLELLGGVLEQTPTVPMLHVLTFRPEFAPPWPTRSHLTPIILNRLERTQVEALMTYWARGKALPAEVVDHIAMKADGVPLYVEELTKMLLDSDLLREEADRYALTGPFLPAMIPDTLQDSLMARLDRLNTAKEIAQLGAVLGRDFAYEMLQVISPQDEETLQAGLAQLVDAELLYQRGRPPQATYRFKHALIQDAAYASLLRSTRQQVHKQVARLLETHFPDMVETQPELVAHHYTEASLPALAVDYWQRAGQQAVQHSANAEAVAHFTKGVELLATLPETSERTQHELTLHLALGVALAATKGFGALEVEHAYGRARALCQQAGDTPQLLTALFGLWRYYNTRAELQTARTLAEQGLSLAQDQHETALLLVAHWMLGQTLFWLGEMSLTRAHLEESTTLYDARQQHTLAVRYGTDPGVTCRAYAATTLWLLGYPAQARRRGHEAVALAQELSHPFSLGLALLHLAWIHQYRREWQSAQERAEALIALATEHGFPLWLAEGTMVRGWALAMQGQGAEGIAQMRQGEAAFQATGGRVSLTYNLAQRLEAHRQVGQTEAGRAVLTDALGLVDQTGECLWEAELYRLQGELHLARTTEHLIEAETSFQQALDIARRQQAKALELRAAVSLARLWHQQGKHAAARQVLGDVYRWFTEGFDTVDLREAKALLEELKG